MGRTDRLSRTGLELHRLARAASRLQGRRLRSRTDATKLPALLFVTDPERTPDPVAVAARLPRGCGVVFRGFGRPDAAAVAAALAQVANARGLTLLVGADAALASRVGAHGVHLPERLLHLAPALRRRRPGWLLTGATHSPAALRRADALGLDAALLSPVFPSASASATGVRPWGPLRFAGLARTAAVPVYALGGVTQAAVGRLRYAAGVAAVAGVIA